MKKRMNILLVIIMILTSSFTYGEMGIEGELRSYILVDFETGEVLEQHNINEVIEIASTSKLMTYLVVMDEVTKGNASLKDNVIIDKDVASVGGSSLKLELGEMFTVEELLEAAMVVSANDATYALSKYIGKTEENFAVMMNDKAMEMGLINARFYNSTGLPLPGGVQNTMTTKELFQLSQHIITRYPGILKTSQKFAIEVASRDYFQKNTNPLLMDIKEVDGLKTGFTNKAGYCYVSTFNILGKENRSEDLRLISIVMGAKGFEERKELSRVLVNHGIDNYSNKIILSEGISLETIEIPKANTIEVETFPREGLSRLVKNDEDVDVRIELYEKMILPIKKGEKIGSVIVERNGEEIFETDIILNEDVKKANWFIRFARFISDIYDKVRS